LCPVFREFGFGFEERCGSSCSVTKRFTTAGVAEGWT
jgi:hypothetical protein